MDHIKGGAEEEASIIAQEALEFEEMGVDPHEVAPELPKIKSVGKKSSETTFKSGRQVKK